jgi:hypothetical protein
MRPQFLAADLRRRLMYQKEKANFYSPKDLYVHLVCEKVGFQIPECYRENWSIPYADKGRAQREQLVTAARLDFDRGHSCFFPEIIRRISGVHDYVVAQVLEMTMTTDFNIGIFENADDFAVWFNKNVHGATAQETPYQAREVYDQLVKPPKYQEFISRCAAKLGGREDTMLAVSAHEFLAIKNGDLILVANQDEQAEFDVSRLVFMDGSPQEVSAASLCRLYSPHIVERNPLGFDDFKLQLAQLMDQMAELLQSIPNKGRDFHTASLWSTRLDKFEAFKASMDEVSPVEFGIAPPDEGMNP